MDTLEEEIETVSQWLVARTAEGLKPHEIGIFVRSAAELDRARGAVEEADLPYKSLDENVETTSGYVSVSTMHLVKGSPSSTMRRLCGMHHREMGQGQGMGLPVSWAVLKKDVGHFPLGPLASPSTAALEVSSGGIPGSAATP